MVPTEKFEKIELTVVSIRGLRHDFCSLLSKVHLEIRAGSQVHKTRGARGLAPHSLNEKFTIDLDGSDDLFFTLYSTRPFGQPILIGSVTVPVDLELRNKDLVKKFSPSNKRKPTIVKYQLGEPDANSKDLRCPFFAFIIGIDEYLSYDIPDLRGCVNDAQTIRAFLINRFHIPEAQIVFLTNEQATREAILEKFQSHLIYNPSIEKDDTIIVYYAGHGSRAGAPDSWPSIDGKIETLVPHDERGKTARGDVIHGIPDRTINTLLSTLATAKGNNITVILDCCHSGGITRGSRPFVLPGARFVETLVPIPENLDQALLWGARAGDVSLPVGISYEFMHSHVLLAACRQQQRARECISTRGVPGGFFTESLIKQLRSIGPNRITYSELVELLPTLPDQIPQCEGVNKDRFIFDIEGPRHNPMSCAFSKKESGVMEVKIGSIHGVVVGTQFVTERDARIGGEPSTTFIAVSVSTESSILTPVPAVSVEDLPLSEGTRLVVSHWNNDAMMMKVYLHSSDDPQLEISDVSTPRTGSSFLLEQSLENADLAVRRVSDEEFSLTRLDTKIPPYAGQDVKLNIPLENLPYALDAVAHFNYFLGRHNGSDPFGDEVQLEMYNLLGDYPSRMPNPDVGNLVVKNEACFALGKDERYGFAICNYSQRDLFPYLFYFDPGTYSIDAWYMPESSTMAAPLPAMSGTEPSRLTVGYGAGGGYAFEFLIPDGLTADTGFLKLFLSTEYLDLKRIEQVAAGEAVGGRDGDSQPERPAVDVGIWSALDIALTVFYKEPQEE